MRKRRQKRRLAAAPAVINSPRRTLPSSLVGLMAVVAMVQLWNPAIYTRELIHLDDGYYVYPLGQMSIGYYVREWLLRPGALAFPVRDATFGFDFWLSRHLGIQTFVLTSTTLFLLYGYRLFELFRLKVSERLSLWMVAIILLHPLNVEVLQWVISRKHLLVGLWTVLSVPLVLRVREGGTDKQWPSWIVLGVLYLAGTLSHPTGIFFPVWVAFALYGVGKLWAVGPLLYLGFCLFVGGGWTLLSATINPDYGALSNLSIGRLDWWTLLIENGLQGMGRLTWQLVVPYQQSVYFEPGNVQNVLGTGIALWGVLGLLVFCWWRLKAGGSLKQLIAGDGFLFGVLALVLFIPEALFLLRRDDFAVADRFLFLPLPYAVLSLSIGLSAFVSDQRNVDRIRWSRSVGETVMVLILCCYTVISARAIPVWNNAVVLARHCIDGVNAPRCWELLVRELRAQGCPTLMSEARAIQDELERRALNGPSPLLVEGFAAIGECLATISELGIDERRRLVEDLETRGAPAEGLAIARGLLALERGGLGETESLINKVFLVDGPRRTRFLTPSILGEALGQLQVVCLAAEQLPGSVRGPCRERLKTFQQLYGGNHLREVDVVSAREAALESLRRGGIAVNAPPP